MNFFNNKISFSLVSLSPVCNKYPKSSVGGISKPLLIKEFLNCVILLGFSSSIYNHRDCYVMNLSKNVFPQHAENPIIVAKKLFIERVFPTIKTKPSSGTRS